jgi:hypothetical protein
LQRGCGGGGQPIDPLGDPGPSFVGAARPSHPHVHVEPVLRHFGFPHLLQGQPRADPVRIAQPRGIIRVILGEVELLQPLLPGGERGRRGFVLIAQRQLPELRQPRRVRAVQRQVDPDCHPVLLGRMARSYPARTTDSRADTASPTQDPGNRPVIRRAWSCALQAERRAVWSRSGPPTPFSSTGPISVNVTGPSSAASTTSWLTSTSPGLAYSAILAARFTVRPK